MATSGVDTMISAHEVEMKAGGGSHDRRTKIKTRESVHNRPSSMQIRLPGRIARVIHRDPGGSAASG